MELEQILNGKGNYDIGKIRPDSVPQNTSSLPKKSEEDNSRITENNLLNETEPVRADMTWNDVYGMANLGPDNDTNNCFWLVLLAILVVRYGFKNQEALELISLAIYNIGRNEFGPVDLLEDEEADNIIQSLNVLLSTKGYNKLKLNFVIVNPNALLSESFFEMSFGEGNSNKITVHLFNDGIKIGHFFITKESNLKLYNFLAENSIEESFWEIPDEIS